MGSYKRSLGSFNQIETGQKFEKMSEATFFDFGNTEINSTMLDTISDLASTDVSGWIPSSLMDKVFSNDKITTYDWSKGASKCIITSGYMPCCTADLDEFSTWEYDSYENAARSDIDCVDLENVPNLVKEVCPIRGTRWTEVAFECPEENRQVCVYDKNGLGCCTDDKALAHSWIDAGCFDAVDGQDALSCYWAVPDIVQIFEEYDTLTFDVSYIYALGVTQDTDYPKTGAGGYGWPATRFNFECPTHLPVPIAAILCGVFIPLILIGAGVGFYFFHKRKSPDKKHEQDIGENTQEEEEAGQNGEQQDASVDDINISL